VQKQGQFRWKSERVFLGTVFQGERVGLRPFDDRYFTVYFAQFPIALFDSRELRILPLPKPIDFDPEDAGEAEVECTPKVRQTIKGPATLNGGEQCWCPDKSIPVN
jgi:hypothetical protein